METSDSLRGWVDESAIQPSVQVSSELVILAILDAELEERERGGYGEGGL